MAKTTIIFALLLILLGLVGYFGTSAQAPADAAQEQADSNTAKSVTPKRSITALIPAWVGVILLLAGLVAMNESFRKHAMHLAVLIGLLGFLAGAGRGAMGLSKMVSGDPNLNYRSMTFVWLMALLCGLFVILCVNSFIQARKRRSAEIAD
jgi:uncharacterized membrane protein HdeD (DUF308 family)